MHSGARFVWMAVAASLVTGCAGAGAGADEGVAAPVAATPELIAQYDVSLGAKGGARAGWSDRTTYVIDTDGTIAFVYSDLKPNEHIARSLAAVRSLKRK